MEVGPGSVPRSAAGAADTPGDGRPCTAPDLRPAGSLRELHGLPLDGLAVDRAEIDRLGPSLLATLAGLARGLALRLAVAGVDAPAALAALDPHEPAGALFGAAVPASLVPELVHAPVITRRDLPQMPAIDATAD